MSFLPSYFSTPGSLVLRPFRPSHFTLLPYPSFNPTAHFSAPFHTLLLLFNSFSALSTASFETSTALTIGYPPLQGLNLLTMTDNNSSNKASVEREASTTPAAAKSQLPPITENQNESTDTLVDTTTATVPDISSDNGLASPPGKISTLTALPPGLANIPMPLPGLPAMGNKYGQQFPESAVSTPIFPMSPEMEYENPFQMASSPEYVPVAGTPARRDSLADSSFSLARVRSEDESIAGSALSDATGAHFRDLDERLRQFVLSNEPHVNNIPAEQIPTKPLTTQEKLALPFSFECAFGWSGAPQELEETPKDKEAFLGKLSEAKNGCEFIRHTLFEYQTEINSRKNHKFAFDFLKKQNEAIIVTSDQLDQIEARIDDVIREVHAISDDHDGQLLKDELTAAYDHVYPWVMRTKRVVYDNHVWYKLNYVMGAHAKPTKLPVSPSLSCLSMANGIQNKNGKPIPKIAPAGNGVQAASLPVQTKPEIERFR